MLFPPHFFELDLDIKPVSPPVVNQSGVLSSFSSPGYLSSCTQSFCPPACPPNRTTRDVLPHTLHQPGRDLNYDRTIGGDPSWVSGLLLSESSEKIETLASTEKAASSRLV